jgi:hypothetical protein
MTLKKVLDSRGCQALVCSNQVVLVVNRQGGWTAWMMAQDAQGKVIKQLLVVKGLQAKWETN